MAARPKRAPVQRQTAAAPSEPFLTGRWLTGARMALELAMATLVFATCSDAYLRAPHHQLTDSQYTVFQIELGLDHGDWAMDAHLPLPRLGAFLLPYHGGRQGLPYQLQVVPTEAGSRIVHWYPPGTFVLSAPLYALARALGKLPAHVDITQFNGAAEEKPQALLAAWVTALAAAAVYLLARGWLTIPWSLAAAWAWALGTMAFSTQSRGLWSSTWAVTLQAWALVELVRPWRARDPQPLRPWLLGTLMAWSWFSRPSLAVHLVLIAGFVAWQARKSLIPLALVGAGWLAAFLVWSRQTYGNWLPDYYRHGKLGTEHLWTSLTANLFSPSRGFVVYAPVVVGVAVVLVVARKHWQQKPLLALAGLAMTAHVALLAVYPTWWAGHAYGARFCVEMLPWLALAAVLAIHSAQEAVTHHQLGPWAWRGTATALLAFALLGVGVNRAGGYEREAFEWNIAPVDVNKDPEKAVWNWAYPQFLIGKIGWPLPEVIPPWPLGQTVQFGRQAREKPYLLERWAGGDNGFRWAYGPSARMAFTLPQSQALELTLDAFTYCPYASCDQSFTLLWNGHALQSFHLRSRQPVVQKFQVPATAVSKENVLEVRVHEGVAPFAATGVRDFRPLGLGVRSMRVEGVVN